MPDIVQQEDAYDLTIWQGKSFELEILFTEDDGETPIPLDGFEARGQIRRYAASTLLTEFETTVDPEAGKVTISLSGTETRKIRDRSVYDLEVFSGPTVIGLLHGDVRLIMGVTR